MSSSNLCFYCSKNYYARGWCINHYMRWQRTGHPLGAERFSFEDRFWQKVNKSGDCWLWTGAQYSTGYGVLNIGQNKLTGAHRVGWELQSKEEIPDNLYVLHHCDIRLCVKYEHLFLGTQKDNIQDMLNKGRHANKYGKTTLRN